MSKITINKILVPTDFSVISLYALEYAALIAKQANAEILMLHVFESYSHNTMLDMVVDFPEIVEKGIEDKMNDIKRKNKKLGDITIHSKVATGKIHIEIERVAREENIKLIVMGTHGVSGMTNISKFIIGSNAYRTIQNAPCPIITIRDEPWKKKFDDILLPLDATHQSEKKVDIAIEWGKFFNSTIHLLAVTALFEELRVNINELEKKVYEVQKKIEKAGLKCTSNIVRHKSPTESVLEYSRKVGAELIIIVTGQENQLSEMLFGSSARNIVSESLIPVLSINAKS